MEEGKEVQNRFAESFQDVRATCITAIQYSAYEDVNGPCVCP